MKWKWMKLIVSLSNKTISSVKVWIRFRSHILATLINMRNNKYWMITKLVKKHYKWGRLILILICHIRAVMMSVWVRTRRLRRRLTQIKVSKRWLITMFQNKINRRVSWAMRSKINWQRCSCDNLVPISMLNLLNKISKGITTYQCTVVLLFVSLTTITHAHTLTRLRLMTMMFLTSKNQFILTDFSKMKSFTSIKI